MSEPTRKKSTSSDSELSDGWSLVDHSDTVPLASRNQKMIPQLHNSQQQAMNPKFITSEETSSDAESVEIIQEDNLTDFIYPHNINRVTKISTVEGEREEKTDIDYSQEKEMIESRELSLTESGSDYFISTSIYSNEWFRLLIFISSLVALLLLLISYTSIFFKEQAYSKSDGLIVLPDEDLSSLIADLALFKEENNRLKEELNMIKYEYGNSKKNEEPTKVTASDNVDIGLELISDKPPKDTEKISLTNQAKTPSNNQNEFKSRQSQDKNLPGNNKKSRTPPHGSAIYEAEQKQVENLARFEDDLKKFANNIGLDNIIISSYNIANNLNNINSIVSSLNNIIDQESDNKKENKKYQIEQKITKLRIKIEQDFKKSVEKVSKRVNKFYNEFSLAYCRIKKGVSDIDGVECYNYLNENMKNKKENKKQADSSSYSQSVEASIQFDPLYDNSVSSSDEDIKKRYKRNNDYDKDFIDKINEKNKNTMKNLNSDSINVKKYYDEGKKEFNKDSLKFENQNNNKKNKENKRSNVYDSIPRGKKDKFNNKKEFVNTETNKFVNEEKIKVETKFRAHDAENKENDNCIKSKSEKRNKINKQKFKFYKSEEAFMKIDNNNHKNPSRTIHNESIYSKIINNKDKRKSEPSGEWYLDLGENRNQKRLRRSNSRDRSGWLFDRALVRDWCRTNSASSLCASFVHNCD